MNATPARAVARPRFEALTRCWVCGGTALRRFHQAPFDLEAYTTQDPELAAYTGETVWLVRCTDCGFGQPERLPALPHYFDRIYDQHWSEAWIEAEFQGGNKDFIFEQLLVELDRRVPGPDRRLLDVGAHAGRFMHLAQQAGWIVEGLELNPRTAAVAASRTGAPVHRVNAHVLADRGTRFQAITLTDVLEHIPDPVPLLASLRRLTAAGGWIAVKVPSGRGQQLKEVTLARLNPRRRVSLAGNLVHVGHFSARSLTRALTRAGFDRITVRTAPPELPDRKSALRNVWSIGLRWSVYAAGRLPGIVQTPFALNLQAFAQAPR